MTIGLKNDYYSCDSETDMFQSDQEEELLKLDYSSQDDDVSPSIFHDNCVEIIAYIENNMKNPKKIPKDDDLNERYNLAARNSLVDMDWRVLKYGENILLGEIKELVDVVLDLTDKVEKRKKRDIQRVKAKNDLDLEMKRISQVLEDLNTDYTQEIKVTTTRTVHTTIPDKPKLTDDGKLKSPVFKVKRVRPINLDVVSISPEKEILLTPEQNQKGESVEIELKPIQKPFSPIPPVVKNVLPLPPKPGKKPEVKSNSNTLTREVKKEFWKLFKDDTEWWKALAKRNLDKMEETRRELERFSGHELVIGDYQSELDRCEKEKAKLQSFIEDVDYSKSLNQDLEYDKKYEQMVLQLINFAKKDFIYKGFDPLIEQLKALSNIKIDSRKKKVVNIEDILNIYTQIDISKYTYEELCLLEKYYKEIIRKYKNKENLNENNIKNIITDIQNRKNVHSSQKSTVKNVTEIFDLTKTYPEEYYANNWWNIYEDVLKNRQQQFGSIDNWWQFYEAVLNKKDTSEEYLKKIREIVDYKSSLRRNRPHSRLRELLTVLDEVKNDRFQESEAVTRKDDESVRSSFVNINIHVCSTTV